MALSNCALKYLPCAAAGRAKCLRYQATPKKGSPPSCGLNLRSKGPSMAESWGRSKGRQAASLKAICSAPSASPLKKRQSSLRRMRRSAPILISGEAAAARPARPSSNDVAARQVRVTFRIINSKDQITAFRGVCSSGLGDYSTQRRRDTEISAEKTKTDQWVKISGGQGRG